MKTVFAVTTTILLLCMVGGPSFAGWTVVNLDTAGSAGSYATGVSDGMQVGHAMFGEIERAGLWRGTAKSWVDLHPAGALESYAKGVSGGRQVGSAYFDDVEHAGLWSGTAKSFVDLHPAGERRSPAPRASPAASR